MRPLLLAFVFSVPCCAPGLAAPRAVLTTHVPDSVAAGAAKPIGAAPPGQVLELSLSLPLRDEPGLKTLARDIADPASPHFRHYLTTADFTARFAPSQAAYDALGRFAAAHGLHARAPAANRLVLDVSGTVAAIEAAFALRIMLYRDPSSARIFYASDREPSADLPVPLLHITGLDDEIPPHPHFARDRAPRRMATGSGPQGNFLGSDVRAAYYGGGTLTGAGQSIGLFEYAGYNLTDVQTYFRTVNQPLDVPVTGVALNGASLSCTGKCDDAEQVLDMEEAISMAPGLDRLIVYVGKNDVSILNRMAADNTSKQLSSSWGWKADAAAIDPILLEFAAQGQSFVDATGDYGYHLKADAVWPGDDQYVTGVGGTDLMTDGAGGPWQREIGWHDSGGGPSPDHIAIPAYQVPFVTPDNNGSRKLRNVPDIAGDADTDNFSCYDGGCSTGNGGTSYAAPLWAGFLALANQQAASMGKPPLGFLNPVLYTIGGAANYRDSFHDQLHGNNQRYIATRNFDLVTGFGSPAGQATIDALIAGH